MAYKSPVYHVIPVPIEKVRPNTYNPNAVAPPEMRLLYESIRADGYTMPIVCYYAKSQDIYVIVDGFHRYRVMLEHPDIYEREGGVLPVSPASFGARQSSGCASSAPQTGQSGFMASSVQAVSQMHGETSSPLPSSSANAVVGIRVRHRANAVSKLRNLLFIVIPP